MKLIFILFSMLLLSGCPKTSNHGSKTDRIGKFPILDEDFANNPEARKAFHSITRGGEHVPNPNALQRELGRPPCDNCEAIHGHVDSPELIEPGDQNSTLPEGEELTEAKRKELVAAIKARGKDAYAKTTMNLTGGEFEVFNDAPTLADGTYVNLTYDESFEIAKAWGCQIPNLTQAKEISSYARQNGRVFPGIPRKAPDGKNNLAEMGKMMRDNRMSAPFETGKSQVVDGHFKWYIDDGDRYAGPRRFNFYGFNACGGFCQSGNRRSSKDRNGYNKPIHGEHHNDYSQSARFICKK